eukprot:TRINITY_DN74564_c0_g1_i2.p1 TRINITY_DN74564_c0_g1~~TRINITY_DN74564_c0_g1_i2.p1  ORF type:complete len:596 (+),score=111.91 TRINITY_DN74564_c0_g1_i2:65-1852(+)
MGDMSNFDSDSGESLTIDDLSRPRRVIPDNRDESESDISVEQNDEGDSDFEGGDTDSSTDDSDVGDAGDAGVANVRGCAGSSQWSNREFPYEFQVFDAYRGPPRPQVRLESAFDYFSLVFPKEAYQIMVTQTNLYARQRLMESGIPEDRLAEKFEPTTVDEIRAYIGLLMFMNVSKLPNRTMYWRENSPYYNFWLSSVMTKSRFEQLARYFHLADSTQAVPRGQDGYDPLYKVRPLISLTQDSFAMQFLPGQNLTVDEAMIKFKGRCGFLQYLPAKPTKWGMKVWALCDADSFYMLNYSVYTGKTNDVPAGSGDALGDRVVKHLTKPHLYKWHTVYFDNYFTSVPIVEHLFLHDTLACGTVRNNRKGLPDGMRPAKCVKKSGDILRWFRQIGVGQKKGKVQAVAWYDRRKVTLLSSAHDGTDGEVVRKGPGGVEKARYSRPLAVMEYSKNFNGVDKHDQLRSYYGSRLKFKKWWKYVLFFCLDTAAVNAYIIYKQTAAAPLKTHLEIQTDIFMGMIAGFCGRKRMGRPPIRDLADRHKHTPSKVQTARGKKECVLCRKEGRKTPAGKAIQSTFQCAICQVGLCKDRGCFRTFHQD